MTCQISKMKPSVVYPLVAIGKDFELLDNYQGRQGTFIKGFLMNDQRNKNGWRVTWDSIKKYGSDFINHPGTYLEIEGDPDHPDGETYLENMSNQEWARVVNIVSVELDEEKHQLNYVGEILPPELSELDFKAMLDDGLINYTSPGIWPEEFTHVGVTESGRPALDVFKWRALHYSYINDPAYTKETAFTIGTCEGDGVMCSTQLAANLAPNDNLAPLQEIKLIRAKLNNIYTPCKLEEIHKEILGDTKESCVSKKLKIISQEEPDMKKDQQLAIAYSFCSSQGLTELVSDIQNNREIEVIY